MGTRQKETRKKHYFPAAVIVLTAACAAFILVMIFLRPHAAKPDDKRNKTEYVTKINGYEMADLSIYGNLRVYDLLDANGFTDYEGSGYNRSYRYDAEDFRKLKGLDESYLYHELSCRNFETGQGKGRGHRINLLPFLCFLYIPCSSLCCRKKACKL